MFLPLLAAHIFYCVQCSAFPHQLKPSSGHDLVLGKYSNGEYHLGCGAGEYLNLCGECVSGKTEKEDGYGKDFCGICGGLGTCEMQCSDTMDILVEEEESKGCLKFISMSPGVLDIAESVYGSVNIFGDGINSETNVDCTISKDESVIPIKTQTLDGKIELTFPLPSKESSYNLHCNTSTSAEFAETLSVVDTSILIPTAVEPSTVSTWKENQVMITVSKLSGPVDVLCFAKTSSDDLLFTEWTSDVDGNILSSRVKCPPFAPTNPEQLELGVAYSFQGIKTAKTVKVMALAEAPRPVKAVFSRETSRIAVTFDQNLEESQADCSALFTGETMIRIGKESFCEIAVNEVNVVLRKPGNIPKILNFKEDSVTTRSSKSGGGGSVEVTQVIDGNDVELPDTSFQCQKGLGLQAVAYPVSANLNKSDIPIGQRQRLNLMTWRSARASTISPKDRSSSTEMTTRKPKSAEGKTTVAIGGQDPAGAWLHLRGPSTVDVGKYTIFQAEVHSCGTLPNPSKYKWFLTSDKDIVDTDLANGPLLKVKPGALLPNSNYKLSVQAFDSEVQTATTVDVKTYIKNFQVRLQDAELVVGNGHPISIDGSKLLDMDSKAIKLRWSCKKGFCYLPGKDKVPLDSLEALASPHLRLPAKTLAVGRYLFALEAYSGGSKLDEAEVEVTVVRGQPPYISSLNIKEEEASFQLLVQVSEIRQKCQFFWSVIPRVGYSYIKIFQDPISVEGIPTHPQNLQMSITLNKTLLIPGTKLLLRVSADCARAGHIYRKFRFFSPDGLNRFRIEVEPKLGEALQTEFVFRLIEKKTSIKGVYSFGYEDNGTQIILHTGLNKKYKTYLGCCKFKTLAKFCVTNSNCITQYGPEIETTLPSNFNISASRLLMKLYKELVVSSEYEEALVNLKMIFPTLEKADPDSFKKYCQEVEEIILQRIADHSDRLKKDKKYLAESVRMLDAASNLMTTINFTEESLNIVLQFRDLVHANTRSLSEKLEENKISENLPREPRVISNIAEAVPKSDMQLSKRFKSDLINGHKGQSMLLTSILHYSFRSENDSLDPVLLKLIGNTHHRLRREIGDIKPKTIGKKDMETVLKATVLPLLQKDGNWNKAREETLKLISIIFDYSKDLCNDLPTPHIIGKEQELVLLGSVPLKDYTKERVKFPFCSSWCPSVKDLLNVNLVNINSVKNSSEGVCLSIASIRDDILTNIVSTSANCTGVRRSAVYWLHAMQYQHGVVPSIFYNVTHDTEPSGNMLVQFPVWTYSTNSSNSSTLECWKFSAEGWNNTACIKTKEIIKDNVTSLQCNCSFPGFFSVFSVDDKKLNEEVSTKSAIPLLTTTTNIPGPNEKSGQTTSISAINLVPTASTVLTTVIQKTSEKQDVTKAPVTLKVPVSSPNPIDLTTMLQPIPSTTVAGQNISSLVTTKMTTSIPKSIITVVTQAYDNDVTIPSIYQPYKYSATFRINESYAEEVGEMKEKFEEHVEDQLQKILNMSESVTLDASKEKDKILIALRIPENKLQEVGYSIALLKDLLHNGSLILHGLRNNRLEIPVQDIVLTQQGGTKSAITAFVTIVFIFLLILIGSVVAAFYLRNNREQRSIRITQDLHSDPPAPKYLRLHDSVSLDSSGPSSPQNNEMESSLAVLTRPHRRGYETMETFSHFPGNI